MGTRALIKYATILLPEVALKHKNVIGKSIKIEDQAEFDPDDVSKELCD
jgi:hypothetical protein